MNCAQLHISWQLTGEAEAYQQITDQTDNRQTTSGQSRTQKFSFEGARSGVSSGEGVAPSPLGQCPSAEFLNLF